jgi:hypothetical protein
MRNEKVSLFFHFTFLIFFARGDSPLSIKSKRK